MLSTYIVPLCKSMYYTTYFRMDNELTNGMIGVDIKACKTFDFSTILISSKYESFQMT